MNTRETIEAILLVALVLFLFTFPSLAVKWALDFFGWLTDLF